MLIISTPSTSRARTRTEGKEETRRRLLEAAATLAAEKGFGNVSLMDIAERAGLTTGAIYSNFRGREHLLMEVAMSQLRSLQGEPPPAGAADLVEMARSAGGFADRPESGRLVALQVELYLLAVRDAGFRAELRSLSERQFEVLARLISELAEAPPALPRPPLSQVAQAFLAMLQGLQQHRLLYPDQVPDELFAWCAAALLRAAAADQPQA